MAQKESHYLPEEEEFGFFTSHLYNIFSRVKPMKEFHQFVLSTVLAYDPGKVMDIGFGTGNVIRLLAMEDQEVELYGVEPSPHMFKLATRKLKKFVVAGRIKLAMGSSREIPFDEKFDVVFSSLSFHHWRNQQESIENIFRFLKPGGRLLIFEYGLELIKGYKKATGAHALSLAQLEPLRRFADFEVHDSDEFRCVVFNKPTHEKA